MLTIRYYLLPSHKPGISDDHESSIPQHFTLIDFHTYQISKDLA